jgi:hypothetical protein
MRTWPAALLLLSIRQPSLAQMSRRVVPPRERTGRGFGVTLPPKAGAAPAVKVGTARRARPARHRRS